MKRVASARNYSDNKENVTCFHLKDISNLEPPAIKRKKRLVEKDCNTDVSIPSTAKVQLTAVDVDALALKVQEQGAEITEVLRDNLEMTSEIAHLRELNRQLEEENNDGQEMTDIMLRAAPDIAAHVERLTEENAELKELVQEGQYFAETLRNALAEDENEDEAAGEDETAGEVNSSRAPDVPP